MASADQEGESGARHCDDLLTITPSELGVSSGREKRIPTQSGEEVIRRRQLRPTMNFLQASNSKEVTAFYNIIKRSELNLSNASTPAACFVECISLLKDAMNSLELSSNQLVAAMTSQGITADAECQTQSNNAMMRQGQTLVDKLRLRCRNVAESSHARTCSESSSKRIDLKERLEVAKTRQSSLEKTLSLNKEIAMAKLKTQELEQQKDKIRSEEEVKLLEIQLAAEELRDPSPPSLLSRESSDHLVSNWITSHSENLNPVPERLGGTSTAVETKISKTNNGSRTALTETHVQSACQQQSFFHDTSGQRGGGGPRSSAPPCPSVKFSSAMNSRLPEVERTNYDDDSNEPNRNRSGHFNNVLRDDQPYYSAVTNPKISPEIVNPNTSLPIFRDYRYVEPSTFHLALMDLKRPPNNPFGGEPHLYQSWISTLSSNMNKLNLPAIDRIEVIENHTRGDALKVVQTFKTALGHLPEVAWFTILEKLQKRFGSDIEIAYELRQKIKEFREIRGRDNDPNVAYSLRELSDLCTVVNAQLTHNEELGDLNQASGLEVIRQKLPEFLNSQWRNHKSVISARHNRHPKFSEFCDFLDMKAEMLCMDVSPKYSSTKKELTIDKGRQNAARVLKAEVAPDEAVLEVDTSRSLSGRISFACPLHRTDAHSIRECSAFGSLNFNMKRLLISSYSLCYRCLSDHIVTDCQSELKCDHCDRDNHVSIMHIHPKYYSGTGKAFTPENRAENNSGRYKSKTSMRTSSFPCNGNESINCSKTVLVEVSSGEKKMLSYLIIDEQSTHSFASPELLDYFSPDSPFETYSISTMSGLCSSVSGRTVSGLSVRGINRRNSYNLPCLFENSFIPDTRKEMATPLAVEREASVRKYAQNFVAFDESIEVHILLGRDAGVLMSTAVKTKGIPAVHETPLGWAIVGNIGLTGEHSSAFSTFRTDVNHEHFNMKMEFENNKIFEKNEDDDLGGLSAEDRRFFDIVINNCRVTKDGNLQFPLPLKDFTKSMPDNQRAVFFRQSNTLKKLARNPDKLQSSLLCMQTFIDHGHVETVPPDQQVGPSGKTWYLPIFPVTHPKKNKTRLVFDSAASYYGLSLNSCLISGPDQNNKLRGVLVRFRENEIGFVADVESMFHSFRVDPTHTDLMRFYWHHNNDPKRELVQYRCLVHVFGNTSSPAVATVGLRRAADSLLEDPDMSNLRAHNYIYRNFYVDDGLGSASSPEAAVDILQRARSTLNSYNINLHKIVANSQIVLNAFPLSVRGKINEVELHADDHHRTLGVAWSVSDDKFVINVNVPARTFSKRGVVSTINSIYDPMGIAAPVVLAGRLFQRQLLPRKDDCNKQLQSYGWDDLLPETYLPAWESWKSSLEDLSKLQIPRCFKPTNFGQVASVTMHTFCDASENAIGLVIYLRLENLDNKSHVSFLYGESKVAPRGAGTIPRLELCAAANACISAKKIQKELSIPVSDSVYYSDSKVTLGYIRNEHRRFTRYVSRRIEIIQNSTRTSQWRYIGSEENPADYATRPTNANSLIHSIWLTGPRKLLEDHEFCAHAEKTQFGDTLPEIKEVTKGSFVTVSEDGIFDRLFNKRRSFTEVVRIASHCLTFMRKLKEKALVEEQVSCFTIPTRDAAVACLVRDAQRTSLSEVVRALQAKRQPRDTHMLQLSPFLSDVGIVRVGGRLNRTDYPESTKHPVILPRGHPLSLLMLEHYHNKTNHQGRVVTHGALRSAGYYLEGGSKVIKKYISACTVCRKLRARCEQQIMADLPTERTQLSPPFTHIGLDVMGPWHVYDGKTTRRTSGTKKLWAVIFTCFYSRAVHVEVISSIDTSAFKNAMRRFLAIRGPCRSIRSDRGSNFVAAAKQEINFDKLSLDMEAEGCKWTFNTPMAPHFGGAWERKVGQIKRCLDEAIMKASPFSLSRDEMHTLLIEASDIVNNTPLWEASYDPTEPFPLCPNMLLTMKGWTPISENFTQSDSGEYGKKRWRKVQYIAQAFWKSYYTSYLQQLQKKQKWFKKSTLGVGDVVLIKDDDAKRNLWPVGIVKSVKHSEDGLVRSVIVTVAKSHGSGVKKYDYERPIHRIIIICRGV